MNVQGKKSVPAPLRQTGYISNHQNTVASLIKLYLSPNARCFFPAPQPGNSIRMGSFFVHNINHLTDILCTKTTPV